jgi:hypothetical protein
VQQHITSNSTVAFGNGELVSVSSMLLQQQQAF